MKATRRRASEFPAANQYWAFDGLNGHIVYYDFAGDHGPGGSDHSDGTVRRFAEATVTRVPDVPSHMEIDHATGILYVADTGAGRIMGLDTGGGAFGGSLPGNWDGLDEYSQWGGATWSQFAAGLQQPSGLALHDGRVFVSDHATQEIIAFDMSGTELGRMQTDATGIMGITVGPNGQLWYADGASDEIVRVDP
ncbi:MAG: hypothetical protein JKY37_13540 [Nannocystaceae bacterium]|nr:hypothetical protein [Nannocystaceae bacterium]